MNKQIETQIIYDKSGNNLRKLRIIMGSGQYKLG